MPELKTALITGASVGIGRALALEFARHGHEVVLVARDAAALEKVAGDCRASGATAHVVAADLASAEGPARVAEELARRSLAVDVLVNNAGFGVHGEFASTELARELELVELQIGALLRLTKAFLPGMIARRRGRILNVSSVYAYAPVPCQAVYGACKAFLLLFSESLAAEVRGQGITVTVLCPGITRTEFRQRAGIHEKKKKSGMSAEEVAAAGYRATMRGSLVDVPGAINRLFIFLVRSLPTALRSAFVGRINRARGVNR